MKSKEEVEAFLRQFKPKMSVWGIFFLGRDKNLDTLKRLGMTPVEREEVIMDIEAEDFCEMINDTVGSLGEMWVFGKDCRGAGNLYKDFYGQSWFQDDLHIFSYRRTSYEICIQIDLWNGT